MVEKRVITLQLFDLLYILGVLMLGSSVALISFAFRSCPWFFGYLFRTVFIPYFRLVL